MVTTSRIRPTEAAEPAGRLRRQPASPRRAAPTAAAAGAYLLLSVWVWWHVWTGHPTTTTTCGCGDTSLFTWFLAWPAYAMSHGLDPLYSTALFHPGGINLLANTGVAGLGIVLAPVTWLFGPVATVNVALTISPALSALAMFVLLRRWVSWVPAAFVGGLLYGFSPFVLVSLTDAHLMLGAAFVPPLLVACVDEALVRQRRNPMGVGVLFGVLAAVQFFLGTEILVIVAIATGFGVVLVVVSTAWRRQWDRGRLRHAAVAGATAAVATGVLVAWPAWYALAGPAHLSGPIWGPNSYISYGGTVLSNYALPAARVSPAVTLSHRLGGYQAPLFSAQYLGLGLLAVLVAGLALFRRDGRLWLFAAVGALSVPLSMGLHAHRWTLWRLFVRLPLMENVIPSRFLIVIYGAAAVMLGLVVDHAHRAVATRTSRGDPGHTGRGHRRRPTAVAAAAGAALAVTALGPMVAYMAGGLPLTVTPVVAPAWFDAVAPTLPPRQVLLVFPVPFDLMQSAMTWQAVDDMRFAMVGGGGPNALASRAGPERAAQAMIGNISVADGYQPVTGAEIQSVRRALDGWGVTMVVLPGADHLPLYEHVHLERSIAVLITAATGSRPTYRAGAWVWSDVERAGPPIVPSPARLTTCSAGPEIADAASLGRSVSCVLGAP